MRSISRVKYTLLLLSVLLTSVSVALVHAQSDSDSEYFDETGHFVIGPFLDFFYEQGGLLAFGYPITDQFYDSRVGRVVQYFERARMEFWPENGASYQVQLGLLGDELGLSEPPVPANRDPNCQYFSPTGHSVCLAFLDFFRQNGGIDVFGYPTSEYRIENDRLVQSFQRALMEWHPGLPRGARVQLANLGVRNFEALGYDPVRVEPNITDDFVIRTTAITVDASLRLPVVGQDDEETIFLVIRNQLDEPVEGALAQVLVHFPTGVETHTLLPSDAKGLAYVSFPVDKAITGRMVNVDVVVHHRGLRTSTRTSFIPWW